jgi:cytochrome c oxidase assembly factor CtaG
MGPWIYVFLGLGVVVLVGTAWIYVPKKLASTSNAHTFEREDKIRTAFGGLITAVAIIIGFFITIYQFQVNQKTTTDQFQANQKNQLGNEMAAIYTDSLKILADKEINSAGHAGAIYALQVPMEYDETYHNTVIAVLLTYLKVERSTLCGSCSNHLVRCPRTLMTA